MKLVVIGAQWGDEGKAKTVDYLAQKSGLLLLDSAVGANAGHTIVAHGKTYKLHLIPSGIVLDEEKVLLGIGMVIDLESLFTELEISSPRAWIGRVGFLSPIELTLSFPPIKPWTWNWKKSVFDP
jgi:adenylosuccinate synthase